MRKILLTLLFLIFVSIVYSQSILSPYATNQDYKSYNQAQKLWKNGDYVEAEKFYRKAYTNSGNVSYLWTLAKNKFEIGDVKGANLVYDIIIKDQTEYVQGKPQVFRTNHLNPFYFEKIDNNFKKGDPEVGLASSLEFVETMGDKIGFTESNLFIAVYTSATETAFALDNKAALIKLHEKAASVKNGEYGEFLSFVYLNILNKDYEKALTRIEEVQKNGGGFMNSKLVANSLLPTLYAHMGENEKALAAIDKAKGSILLGEDYFHYVYGLIALNKKDYKEAVDRFTKAIKGYKFIVRIEPAAKYKHYTKRAEAYLGLGDLIQARKDYESALVYNPSFEPALNGIAKLEGRMINNLKTDKTPPVIVITEPAVSRGLKVTANGNDIMVRGKATDAAGIKSVTLNGQQIYSKNDGDFWGNVSLAAGANKIVVKATDLADNSIEETFEIEKPVNPVNSSTEIVPVTVKEGRNFAVLIASQNYEDSSIPSLENPISDAVKLKMVLKNSYNFTEDNVLTLFNPERSDFKKKFLQISELLQPEDNLIIFYAGHGIWVDKEKKGYWLLTDAKRNDVNTWLPNKEVLNMIAELPARHTLLITDACFSGSVFKTRGLGANAPTVIKEMDNKISRVAITSGNDTEVPDESVFMKYLVKALSENKEKYLTAQKMFITQIIEAVMNETKTEPRYGTLELAGHVGGDFIFSKK
ncbi:caspase family protein [Solitalea koreensis]|uniref:Caspase domain-containing protein n=1 Tax=Solitalea koreensis TaxID=543615 RepID=A0A521BBL8_9SPHI|nr:caspase family protein [Solitalea koreensis]SMO44458.1 Caspase domain-containing protein [Solitalea koreensis]